ncbi:hypothetical protein RchiOBHm_Chr2g0128861 [Rosa chinensis]|uniref:Uncharacterized protein n=1 Tax=Rosa chinensis TaxID=74649 RepID=A0A2P6RUF5_ROSCH|nr:uncharacterized protein LOC112186562 [Rosa chinensis]XP_024180787.1 uncharacterized protein LOC112186562 [Rosa chinensis]PRQ50058.1 hypothetical protein RchiOBHm_Chr2g0128861 [Rosa chinensis]
MTQVEGEEEPQNPNSQFETLTLQPPPQPQMKPQPDSNQDNPDAFPVRSPRSRTAITFARKKRKKTGRNPKASQKKLEILRQTLKPIPFVPAKTLDFDSHEELLKRLGLWDFVHIKFDRSIRADLLAQLIVNFNSQQRCSYVNELRILVNRSDLGRALKLPVMLKSKKSAVEDAGEEQPPASEESIAFLEDLVSNWMLLHGDMWMMPGEVLGYTKAIKEGQFGKVDWAGLVWYMVNEELGKATQLENCYYASHLQHLIKSQKEDLFSVKQESKVEIDLKDDDEEEEEEDGGGDVKMDDVQGGRLEENDIKLCLGQENVTKVEVEHENLEKVDVEREDAENVDDEREDAEKVDVGKENVEKDDVGQEKVEEVEAEQENVEKVDSQQGNAEKVDVGEENVEKVCGETERVEVEVEDEDVMDFEEFKEAEPAQWVLAGKDNLGEPCLQRCNLGGIKDLGCGDERNKNMELGEGVGEEEQEDDEIEEEEEEDDDQEGGFHLLPKGFSLEGFPSGNLTQGMDGMPLRDHFGIEFPSPRDLMLPGSSSIYGNGPKREINHENDNSHHGLNGNKRLRTEGSWDSKMSGDFETGMDQIQQWLGRVEDMQQWMGKARMMYTAKEQECQQAANNQQYFMQELQRRDEMIEHLHKARFEDQQKFQTEKFRFEHEVHLMKNLLDGYRKALKATQKAFAEHRAHCPQAVEPLYRDVPGSGGLVLSTTELEKLRIKQEEEERINRLAIETMIKDFEAGWSSEYEAHQKSVELASSRLMDVEKEVKLLKEGLLKQRLPETQESPNES